jgi:phenol 2-monooxygenase (NADPH)
MGVSYDGTGSALISESGLGIWKAGRRCPDLALLQLGSEQQAQPEPQRLYSIPRYGQFLVIQVGTSPVGDDQHPSPGAALDINIRNPGYDNNGQPGGPGKDERQIFQSDLVNELDAYVVVVRPDMYIGYVGSETGADEYIAGFLA